MKLLNCLLVLAFLFLVSCNSAARIELQVENLLKGLNKPPQKSIKSLDGDIIDCKGGPDPVPPVQRHWAQSAKGPKIKENPAIFMLEHPGLGAPLGHKKVNRRTIPVRRTKKEDVLRASSIENFGRKDYPFMIDNSQEQANGMPGFKVAIE